MIVDEGGSLDGCENSKRQKCIDSTYNEKTSYADILGDDYDIDSRCDFVKALLSDFMENNEKDAKDCLSGRGCRRGGDGDQVYVSNF